MKAKYIVIKTEHDEFMIVFPSMISHDVMKKAMNENVVSAGFIDEFCQCYGESYTLGIGSREEDTVILKHMLCLNDKIISFY